MQQLGVILTPYGAHSPYGWYAEIAQARGGNGQYLNSAMPSYPRTDRRFNERGEPAYYYDTQLGSWQTPKTKVGAAFKTWWGKMFGPSSAVAPAGVMPPRGSGAIPTDAELAINTQCYTPVASGWTNTKNGFVPGTWRFGWNPAGDYGPPSSLNGLRDAAIDPGAAAVIAAMNAHNQRMFQLAIVSTAAVSISAMFTLFTRWKRLKHDLLRPRKR